MDLVTPDRMITGSPPETREIPLTRGLVTVVDTADYEFLSRWAWCAAKGNGLRWYATRNRRADDDPGGPKTIFMHRVILNAPSELLVDHRDLDGLNNRRSNLRVCGDLENSRNRAPRLGASSFKGVCRRSEDRPRPWRARIWIAGRPIELGYFTDEIGAARAYDDAALLHFGDFARLNFPRAEARP